MSEKANYIEKLKEKPELLKTLPKEYLADKDIIRAALVRTMPYYISDDVFFSMFSNLELFEIVDDSLKNDVEFVNELINSCSGYLFQYLPEALRNDKEIYLFAIKHSGFEYVYQKLIKDTINDDNFDLEDIKNLDDEILHFTINISITEYAGDYILNDKATILKALESDPLTFQFLNEEMKLDADISQKALSFGTLNIRQINKNTLKTLLPKKTQFINKLKEDPYFLKRIPKEYLADKDIIRAALVRKWYEYIDNIDFVFVNSFEMLELFKYADASLQYDKGFVLELIASCSGYLFEILPPALRNDEKILFFALKHSGFEYVYERLLEDAVPDEDEEWCEEYIEVLEYLIFYNITDNKTITKFAGETLLNNKSIALKILEFDPTGFVFFSDTLKDDYDVAMAAVSNDASNFDSISDRLQSDPDFLEFEDE
jgi:hypothetical protein